MAFFQETGSRREPILHAPAVVLWLIAVVMAAHVGRTLLPPDISNRILIDYAFIPARYSQAFLAQHNVDPGNWFEQTAPFVGYIFLHANLEHLLINCLWLLAFGPIVARRFGGLLFLVFFILCGVAAAAVHLAFNWGSADPVIGASGAISGLMAAGIRMLHAWPRGPEADQKLMPIFSTQVLVFTGFWVLVNVLAGLTGFGTTGGHMRLIAWQAHLGGYGAGLILVGAFDALHRLMRPKGAAQA